MISEIQIGYFQAHKDSVIEFDDGVNVITGTSDAGKSSITRLIEWVVMNRPSGEEFKNWHIPAKAAVTGQIVFDNGFIYKERNKENLYETPEGALKALRTDLPPEITNITQMSEINIQSQHSPYFLIGEKPAEVTRKLNEIVGLTVIDRLFGNMNKRLYALRTNLKYEEKGITQDREEIARLTPYRKLRGKYDKIINLVSARDKLLLQKASLESKLAAIKKETIKKDQFARLTVFEKLVSRLLEEVQEYKKQTESFLRLTSLVEGVAEEQKKKERYSQWLGLSIPVSKLAQMVAEREAKEFQMNKLQSRSDYLRNLIHTKGHFSKMVTDLLEQYKKALIEAEICPTCTRPITKEEAERIVGDLA